MENSHSNQLTYTKLESLDNKLVKHISKLINSKSYRCMHGSSVLLGEHLILEAVKYGVLGSVLVVDDKINKYLGILEEMSLNTRIYSVSNSIMCKIIRGLIDSSCNIIGVANLTKLINNQNEQDELPEICYSSNCLVLEDIQDPGNIGTILRGAYAFGINQVILSKNCADAFSPKVLRSSQGVSLGLQIYVLSNLSEFLSKFTGDKIVTLPNLTTSIYDFTPSNPNSIAWVFGNEGSGVSLALKQAANLQLSVPMCNKVDSLNVAMAATVCMFEHLRWRLKVT
jgi:RNA methyltransferase, TrmH family